MMTDRVFNFSAGPAMLPDDVLKDVQSELLDWNNSGMSVMEVSHRSKEFISVAETSEADLREILNIPDDFKVLFLQGGATGQFSSVPLNISRPEDTADYIITGNWGKKAFKEAKNLLNAVAVSDESGSNFTTLPNTNDIKFSNNPAYIHITPNETVYGVEFDTIPKINHIAPVVADLSSTILSRPINFDDVDLLYAGAQKNIGPAGITIVIIRENLLNKARIGTPEILNYTTMSESDSMYNTPPTLAWYIAAKVFQWIKNSGGVEEMYRRSSEKSKNLYEFIDNSNFYNAPVEISARSKMNVVFTLKNNDLDAEFIKLAEKNGLTNLKGHRSIGGMRASIYNAMSIEGVNALINFMKLFEKEYN